MRKMCITATVGFALLSGAAQSQTATPWGDEAGCVVARGGLEPSDSLIILWPDRIDRYESGCAISTIEGDMGDRAVITTECHGEGETWTSIYHAASVGNLLAMWHQDAPDYVMLLRPCG